MQKNNLTPGRPMELPEIDMHGPFEVSIKGYFRTPGGEIASMTIYAEPGQLPARAQQLAIAAAMTDAAQLRAAGAPAGARALSKGEFLQYLTKRHTGAEIPLPGRQEFVPASCEIPHGMLVHAIMGASVREALAVEYADRKLLEIEDDGTLQWNSDLLGMLPDTILLAMYQRIVAPAPEGAA